MQNLQRQGRGPEEMTEALQRHWEITRAVPMAEHAGACMYPMSGGRYLCDCPILRDHPEYRSQQR